MKRIFIRYLCIATLGVVVYPTSALATGANPGPTCDEIGPAHLCSPVVPEIIVTAPPIYWDTSGYMRQLMRRLSDQALQGFISASVATIQAEVIEAISTSQVRRAQTAAVDERARRDYERRVEEFKKEVADWSERNCSEMAFAARTAGLTVAVSAAVISAATTGPFAGITVPPLVHILSWGATVTGDAVESFVCSED